MKTKEKAFTLIEIMVAIAIVGILSAVVMVSLKSFSAKARSTKAQALVASLLPRMIGCWGNGGNVSVPTANGTGDVCSLGSSFGAWPAVGGTTDLSSYTFTATNSSGNIPSNNSWYVKLQSGWSADRKRVCCNGVIKNCVLQDQTGPLVWPSCDETHPTD
jgi:prepilin-type N-terminal cleavage/methylation domain-containing protein